jgi:hypothetical protein
MTTQGKALTLKEKETIVALKKYFDRTRDDLLEQASPSVQKVVNALGVGVATVKRVMADHNRRRFYQNFSDRLQRKNDLCGQERKGFGFLASYRGP